MKAKFDAESLKELCIHHVEKAVFGIFVIFFLLIVWSSLGVKGYDKKPAELQSAITTAQSNFQMNRKVNTAQVDYVGLVSSMTEPVALANLDSPVDWNPIPFAEQKKREAPLVLPVEDLHVVAVRGKVNKTMSERDMMRFGPDGEPLEPEEEPKPEDDSEFEESTDQQEFIQPDNTMGVVCCVVTGAIPYNKQMKAYEDALGVDFRKLETRRDLPTYYAYEIERAEIPEGGNEKNLEWKPFDISKDGENYKKAKEFLGNNNMGNMSAMGNEMGAMYNPPDIMRYPSTKSTMAQPMPTAGMEGDDRGMIPSKMYTLKSALPPIMAGSNTTTFNWKKVLEYPKEIDMDKKPTQPQQVVARPANPNGVVEEDEEGEEHEVEEDPDMMANMGAYDMRLEASEPYRLFQFVDYTVESGKRYAYRVRLKLWNPNYKYEPRHLVADPNTTKNRFLDTAWSAASPIAMVKRDERFFLGGVEFPNDKTVNGMKGPYLTLLLVKYDKETGTEKTVLFKSVKEEPAPQTSSSKKSKSKKPPKAEPEPPLLAGQLLNLLAPQTDIRTRGGMGEAAYGMRGGYDPMNQQQNVDVPHDEFKSNFILLDVRGGDEMLYKEFKPNEDRYRYAGMVKLYADPVYSPSQVLIMDPDGKFMLQDELEDYPEVFRSSTRKEVNAMQDVPSPDGMDKKKKGRKNRDEMGGTSSLRRKSGKEPRP